MPDRIVSDEPPDPVPKRLKIQGLGKPSIPLPHSSPGTGKLTVSLKP